MITSVIFDIDGTMLDSGQATINAFKDLLERLRPDSSIPEDLSFTMGMTTDDALRQLGLADIRNAERIWMDIYQEKYAHTARLYEGVEETLKKLKSQGYRLAIATSKNRAEYNHDFAPLGLAHYFDAVICLDDVERAKPAPDPVLAILKATGIPAKETLLIGDTAYDRQCASAAGISFGLAMWGRPDIRSIRADYYFNHPRDIPYTLDRERNSPDQARWLKWAVELQFIAQAGITYSRDPFDIERFTRLREISAEIMKLKTGLEPDTIKSIFCNETGFQTPKLDTRAAIFRDNKILLVKETNGKWSLPGGWVDVNQSIKTNTVKEVREEAGLNVVPAKLIALLDRNLHNPPVYAYGVTKAFVLCYVIDGQFTPNHETLESGYFTLDEIPALAEEKNTLAQIELCFEANEAKNWTTVFD